MKEFLVLTSIPKEIAPSLQNSVKQTTEKSLASLGKVIHPQNNEKGIDVRGFAAGNILVISMNYLEFLEPDSRPVYRLTLNV